MIEIASSKKPSGRILAVDFGLARIGLAISDVRRIIATPLSNLLSTKDVKKAAIILKEHLEILKKDHGYDIEEIVVGLPLMLNGQDSDATKQVRLFTSSLQEIVPIPVHLFDERLTSVQADRSLREGNFTRKKRAQFVDRISAVILLQVYLDYKAIQLNRDAN